MECHLGHGHFPCRNRVPSRVVDRFAARILCALDGTQFRRNQSKFVEVFPSLRQTHICEIGIIRRLAA
ncbi:MAG TPA: hypothetical protein DCY26_06945 [Hyphomonas sp.]|nr:hypothetical protein [Hyphomonas sp.]